jgi:hypothetical protein
MRHTLAFVIFANAATAVFGQLPDSANDFARIAAAPGSTVIRRQSIGALADDRSKVEISALVVRGAAPSAVLASGMRVDLFDGYSRTTTYLSLPAIEEAKRMLDEIGGSDETTASRSLGLRWRGSCEQRDHPERYPIHVNFLYAGPGSPAIRIDAGDHSAILHDHQPSGLSALFEKALRNLDDK